MMDSTLSGFISVGLWIDNVIYSFIGIVYNLLIDIANYEIFSQETISEFSNRVYALLGIFMLFKLTFSLITYVVNPDDLADKTKGLASIGKNVIISLILIVLTPYIFAEATKLQKIVLSEHTLENLVFGAQSDTSAADIDNGGQVIQFNLFSQFVKPNYQDIEELESCRKIYYDADEDGNYDLATDPSTGQKIIGVYELNPLCFGEDNSGGVLYEKFEEADAKLYFENYKNGLADQNYRLLVNNPEVYAVKLEVGDNEYSLINYQFVISTVVGIVVLLILVTFCIDIAVRTIKLAFYQIIAPIPIVTLCDPKSSKSGMFNKWMKACFSTYLSLFIRLLALYLAIYVISAVVSDIKFEGFALVFVIIGALIFAKELPKIITDLTGIKLDGKFTLNPFKKIENEALGGKSLLGAAGGMVAGAVGGHGFFGRIGSAFTGTARGFADGKGFESGLARQADVNRKLRDARINGASFFGARVAAVASKFGLEDADLETRSKKIHSAKRAIEAKRIEIDQKTKANDLIKKAEQNKIAPKEMQIKKTKSVATSGEALVDFSKKEVTSGKAGLVSHKSDLLKSTHKYLSENVNKVAETNSMYYMVENGRLVSKEIKKGDVITADMAAYANGAMGFYDNKEGAMDHLDVLLHQQQGLKPKTVQVKISDDVYEESSMIDTATGKPIMKLVKKAEYITEYEKDSSGKIQYVQMSDDEKKNFAKDKGDFIAAFNSYETSKTNAGMEALEEINAKAIKGESDDLKNKVSAMEDSISESRNRIAEIEDINRRLQVNATVVIDGKTEKLEEIENRINAEAKSIEKEKERRKQNRQAADISKILNGKK